LAVRYAERCRRLYEPRIPRISPDKENEKNKKITKETKVVLPTFKPFVFGLFAKAFGVGSGKSGIDSAHPAVAPYLFVSSVRSVVKLIGKTALTDYGVQAMDHPASVG
jgi:hypothetical protein